MDTKQDKRRLGNARAKWRLGTADADADAETVAAANAAVIMHQLSMKPVLHSPLRHLQLDGLRFASSSASDPGVPSFASSAPVKPPGATVHVCGHCQKRFRSPARLAQHERGHTDTGGNAAPLHRSFYTGEPSGQKSRALMSIAALERRIANAAADIEAAKIGQATRSDIKRLTQAQQRLKAELAAKTSSSTTRTSTTLQSVVETPPLSTEVSVASASASVSGGVGPRRVSAGLLVDAASQITKNQNPYACSISPMRFATKSDVPPHERAHTGERLYACSMCPKRFAKKSQAARHTRAHAGERPYACSICPQRFATKRDVPPHERTHTGEKPYGCSYCGKTFVASGAARKHERTQHR